MAVGARYERKASTPLTLTLDDQTIHVTRGDLVHRPESGCARCADKDPVADLTTYQSKANGQPVRIEAALGITKIREPGSRRWDPPAEYRPRRTSLFSPACAPTWTCRMTQASSLDIRLSASGQGVRAHGQAQSEGDGKAVTMVYIPYPACGLLSPSPLCALTDASLQGYLKPASYIDSDAPSIREQAQKIVGGEKNIYRASSLIREWVNARMKPQSDMGILRPASDVLKNPSGVCRDYAVLFAALARASGIPTRVIRGLVFSRGDFYYHAWNEVWTGETWAPFDATVETDFVTRRTSTDGRRRDGHVPAGEGDRAAESGDHRLRVRVAGSRREPLSPCSALLADSVEVYAAVLYGRETALVRGADQIPLGDADVQVAHAAALPADDVLVRRHVTVVERRACAGIYLVHQPRLGKGSQGPVHCSQADARNLLPHRLIHEVRVHVRPGLAHCVQNGAALPGQSVPVSWSVHVPGFR